MRDSATAAATWQHTTGRATGELSKTVLLQKI